MLTSSALHIIAITAVITIQWYIYNAKSVFTQGILYWKLTELMDTGNVCWIFLVLKIKILIFCSSVACTKVVLNVPLLYFIARCKVLSNVCFVYLCKACNCEGQCHEILRALPSVCEKMRGVAAVKAECSGEGGKFYIYIPYGTSKIRQTEHFQMAPTR